jgi:hypothetical protein
VEEVLIYADFLSEHWTRTRTNDVIDGQIEKYADAPVWWAVSLMATQH